jgi:hypothetical protein
MDAVFPKGTVGYLQTFSNLFKMERNSPKLNTYPCPNLQENCYTLPKPE